MKKSILVLFSSLIIGWSASFAQVLTPPADPNWGNWVVLQPYVEPIYLSLNSSYPVINNNTSAISSLQSSMTTAQSNITTLQGQISTALGISQNYSLSFYCGSCVGSVVTVTARLKKDAMGIVTLTIPSFSNLAIPLIPTVGALITTLSAPSPTPLPAAYRPTTTTQIEPILVNSGGLNQNTLGAIQVNTAGHLTISANAALLGFILAGNVGIGFTTGSEVTVTYPTS